MTTLVSTAYADDITMSLDQRDYYFKTGGEALVPLKINNSHPTDIVGILKYTVSQESRQSGVFFSTANSMSNTLIAPKGEKTVQLNFGTSSTPATFKVTLKYLFTTKENREVDLGEIKIHFVSDDSKMNNKKNPLAAGSQKAAMPGPGGGGGADPFNRFNRMEKEMDEMMKKQREEMNRMMKRFPMAPRMPRTPNYRPMPSSPGSTGKKLPNSQIPQDSQALKRQIQKQLQQKNEMKKEFQNKIAQNDDFLKKHNQLKQKGYQLDKEKYNPKSKDTGSFNLKYKNQEGKTANIKGKMEQGQMKSLQSMTSEEKEQLQQKIQNNNKFKSLTKKLKKQGYKQGRTTFKKDGDKIIAKTEFKDKNSKKAEIKTQIEKGNVTGVKLEKEPEKEDERKPSYWTLLTIAILAILGYAAYKHLYKKPPQLVLKSKPVEKKLGFAEEARKLLGEAKKSYEEKQYKEAYAKVNRAMRLYLIYKNGLEKEQTNDELIRRLKQQRMPVSDVKECFDTCALVEFAKYEANDGDFSRIMKIAEERIGVN